MSSNDSPYEEYLNLAELLSLQRPLTPRTDTSIWAAEHFFIVIHQSCELLLHQAILDLTSIDQYLRHTPLHCVEQVEACLSRVEALVRLLHHHLDLFDHLPPQVFAAFRTRLKGASGAQSSQFAELFSRTGTGPHAGDVGGNLAENRALVDSPRLNYALHALQKAVHEWQEHHVSVVRTMIGGQRGTGGTSGARYLSSRVTSLGHETLRGLPEPYRHE
ncbi:MULTISPECIES: tryptophan 2,3-dioxygenase family protein [unclassified Streptomyces]|uniref:tryptophan 2,3-dioxygenase family protein n=1 Tax=unclassified Streptomyces TaxID=2593676 RepID=UPI001CBE83CA|nr:MULTISPECIES: tryptophan 2,3-dioxygenase family protein [unclassified Streptomyces]WPO70458.1 tryptophan 2,3-dioxygenase family protein [Streptomyces sp. KN37]